MLRIAAVAALAGALSFAVTSGAATAGSRSSTDATIPLTLLDLGDSLSIGTAPYLRPRLPRYRIARRHDVGLHAYDAAVIVAEKRPSLPSIVVVSAGTNDDPRMVSMFRGSISRILAVTGPDRCVIWPTIARPPAAGASYEGLNRALSRAAQTHLELVLVDWVGMVRRHPEWLSRDGVHVSVAGYRARAAAIATAVTRRCTV